jgi:hypothetical protein
MVKGFMFQQQQQQPQQQQVMEENMSNLTSASGEASEIGTSYSQEQYLAPPTQTVKKKRNLPGNPGLFSTFFFQFHIKNQNFIWFDYMPLIIIYET